MRFEEPPGPPKGEPVDRMHLDPLEDDLGPAQTQVEIQVGINVRPGPDGPMDLGQDQLAAYPVGTFEEKPSRE
jgi:hypothetical protein